MSMQHNMEYDSDTFIIPTKIWQWQVSFVLLTVLSFLHSCFKVL